MRRRVLILVVVAGSICAVTVMLLSGPRVGSYRLWRLRANLRMSDTTVPQSKLESKVGHYVSLVLGEGTNVGKNVSDSRAALLKMGRFCQRDFELAEHSDPVAYQGFWDELSRAVPGASVSQRGKPGPRFYVVTNIHVIAAVEDMPKLEKVVAQFNSGK